MLQLIQQFMPNVYRMGWSGQAGWGTAIYLTLYMTIIPFFIGGVLGFIAGLLLVLTGPRGILENRLVFFVLDKVTSIFRAIPFIILLALINPFTRIIVGTGIGPTAALVPLSLAVFPFFARQVQVVLSELDRGVIEAAHENEPDSLCLNLSFRYFVRSSDLGVYGSRHTVTCYRGNESFRFSCAASRILIQ